MTGDKVNFSCIFIESVELCAKSYFTPMSEQIDNRQVFSLYEVTRSIQKTLSERYSRAYWIKAELNKLNYYQHSGHCYPELVEKRHGKVVTQLRSVLWKDDYRRINAEFQALLNEPLKDGIKILFSAKIDYHPHYGLSLHIQDIDPSFTLGDLEKEKQEAIKRLKAEGVYQQNKRLKMPLLPKRIAVISVETSKGYADFLNVLGEAHQSYGYAFFQMLFPSLLQGDNAVKSMLQQLRRIRRVAHHFDVVIIVRGGGGDIGLSCYNNYALAREVATFPIPVLTGIGHSTNETVTEMVAHQNTITPTKLAEIFVQKCHEFAGPLLKAEERIIDIAQRQITQENQHLRQLWRLFRYGIQQQLLQHRTYLNAAGQHLNQQSQFALQAQAHQLHQSVDKLEYDTLRFSQQQERDLNYASNRIEGEAEQQLQQAEFLLAHQTKWLLQHAVVPVKQGEINVKNLAHYVAIMDPKNVLKRGYSITLHNGKAVTTAADLTPGDSIVTRLYDGSVESVVETTNKSEEL